MLSLKRILFGFCLSFLLLILNSCSNDKEKEELIEFQDDFFKYIIEMDKEFIFSKISSIHDTIQYIISLEYTDKEVRISYSDKLIDIYFLNESGLADSSGLEYGFRTYYTYDNNGYLVSIRKNNGHTSFEYSNGNMSMFRTGMWNKGYYSYSPLLPNLVDLEYLRGAYLGKINKNLKTSVKLTFASASNTTTSFFNYEINSSGLVTRLIQSWENSHSRHIYDYEYIIK
jgi:YD repeat-containing protein